MDTESARFPQGAGRSAVRARRALTGSTVCCHSGAALNCLPPRQRAVIVDGFDRANASNVAAYTDDEDQSAGTEQAHGGRSVPAVGIRVVRVTYDDGSIGYRPMRGGYFIRDDAGLFLGHLRRDPSSLSLAWPSRSCWIVWWPRPSLLHEAHDCGNLRRDDSDYSAGCARQCN